MKMKSVVIRTKDMDKSLGFYEKILHFTFVSMISPQPGKRIAFLTEPESGTQIELLHNEAANLVKGGRISLTFIVDQIAETEKYLVSNNVRIISPPRTIRGGKKILTAVDPNDIELDFIEE
ncbi:VOC family protein [Treponema phagedenis]|uniref:Glyoxalase family protein n=1 Tax=Treponema phagedenis TaxID=162 RepID=A0A0B7GVR9_TREPH|nr:VOC family protein [Treponema phagedenis]EFW37154.1 glyoxalase family protein [Treponema phagedenis F0421]NVP23781.1 VOC family protein [Treponema phagedenis]QEJ94414.1 VOC family protein [Treponema phagedenis]QEJ97462.1 VOC family protein [Treponema phagedenis]QEK01706.1 VOC family protein [Treponema phagedenis]